MPEPDPTVRGQELGDELRSFRELAELTLAEAARRIDLSASTLSRVETGRRRPAPEDVAALLAVYGVTGPRRSALLELTRDTERRGWWQQHRTDVTDQHRTLASLEAKAEHIITVDPAVVPSLLRTSEYARSVLAGVRSH